LESHKGYLWGKKDHKKLCEILDAKAASKHYDAGPPGSGKSHFLRKRIFVSFEKNESRWYAIEETSRYAGSIADTLCEPLVILPHSNESGPPPSITSGL
jgi:hypothetical protein